MFEHQKNKKTKRLEADQKEILHREDDSEEGSQLQSSTLEQAMGNKKEE